MDKMGKKIVQAAKLFDSKATMDKLMVLMRRAQENGKKKSGRGADIICYI